MENIIKFENVEVRKKGGVRSSKVRGSWMNLKCRGVGHVERRQESDGSLFQQKPSNNSYSRTLQKLSKKELEIMPGKTLYGTISQPGKEEKE